MSHEPVSDDFASVPPATLADVLGREQVMDIGIRPPWPSAHRARIGKILAGRGFDG